MASIRTTTQTRASHQGQNRRYALLLAGLAFMTLGAVNCLGTMTPREADDSLIDKSFANALVLPASERIPVFKSLLISEADNLATRPSNPYGWARLSYLRLFMKADMKAAFAALAMADLVAPFEAPELPERAAMWERFKKVETPGQLAYQDVLWAKAYRLEPDLTWTTAQDNRLGDVVAQSLDRSDIELAKTWKNHGR